MLAATGKRKSFVPFPSAESPLDSQPSLTFSYGSDVHQINNLTVESCSFGHLRSDLCFETGIFWPERSHWPRGWQHATLSDKKVSAGLLQTAALRRGVKA
jgi:hypothetical protein